MAEKDFDHFPELMQALHDAAREIVRKAAFDIEAHSKANIRANGQIDTGNMVNGVYTSTDQGSTYPGSATRDLAPEAPKPENDTTAYVGYAANYSIYQNYGTRYQPARPFVEPAVDKVRPSFERAFEALEDKLRGAK